MSISETVKRAALAWIRATEDSGATEVTCFTDRTEDRGNCDTYGYTVALVDVNYKTSLGGGWNFTATYQGDFAEFIQMLDQYDI